MNLDRDELAFESALFRWIGVFVWKNWERTSERICLRFKQIFAAADVLAKEDKCDRIAHWKSLMQHQMQTNRKPGKENCNPLCEKRNCIFCLFTDGSSFIQIHWCRQSFLITFFSFPLSFSRFVLVCFSLSCNFSFKV